MSEVLLHFTIPRFFTFFSNCETNVEVYPDCVDMKRKGKTGMFPIENTIYFSEVSSITFGKQGNDSWITFVAPGNRGNGPVMATRMTSKLTVASGPSLPLDDPNTIFFRKVAADVAESYYRKIQEIFTQYRNHYLAAQAAIVQSESAVDTLKKLKELIDLGILSEAEYEEKRQKLLNEI